MKEMYEGQEPRTMAQEPRNMYQDGQLVQNTADGSRPGYQGKKGMHGETAKVEPYKKDFKFQKFYKKHKAENPNVLLSDAIKSYERSLLRKNKIVGIPKLFEALGKDSPYSLRTLVNSYAASNTKITKNM